MEKVGIIFDSQFYLVIRNKVAISSTIEMPFIYSISNMNGVLNLTSLMSINKGIFLQPEYAHLREFYNQIVAKQAELIVLKKK